MGSFQGTLEGLLRRLGSVGVHRGLLGMLGSDGNEDLRTLGSFRVVGVF